MSTATLSAPRTVKATSYGTGSGLLLEPAAPGANLSSVGSGELLGLLSEAGFLLLRGFGAGMASFTELVQRTSTTTTLDPARDFYSEVAQKVDAGYDEVGLHTENGNSPFRSHLAWFFCEKAASSGSQTTVCDGHRVWDALSESARSAFAAQDIVYSRYVAEAQWRAMAHHLLGKPAEEIDVQELVQLAAALPGTEVMPQEDGESGMRSVRPRRTRPCSARGRRSPTASSGPPTTMRRPGSRSRTAPSSPTSCWPRSARSARPSRRTWSGSTEMSP